MDKDIVPKLLEEIKEEFNKKLSDSEVNRLSKELLELNKANFGNANDYAIELGEILAKVFNDKITTELLPEGRMYYNIAERIVNDTLKNNHKLISQYSTEVQTILNKQAGLNIKGLSPELNQDRINGIIERLSKETDFEQIKWILNEPIINFSQAIVDDTVKANTNFQYKTGLKPKVKRTVVANCCDWCREVEGTYEYPNIPENVYKRHRYCRCTVTYIPGDGKERVVSKNRAKTPEEKAKIEARKKIGL